MTRMAAVLLLMATTTSAQTIDEVLARHLAARGGQQRLQALQTVRFSGTVNAPSQDMAFQITKKRPNLLRVDLTAHGLLTTQAFDGRRAWQNSAVPLSAALAADLVNSADFDGPLVGGAAKGYQLALAPSPPTEPLIITARRNGIEETVALDRTSFLVVRHVRGNVETMITEYRTVDGLAFPVAMTRTDSGSVQHIKITDIKTNLPLPDQFFKETNNAKN